MTPSAFVRSLLPMLPHRKDEALEQLRWALHYYPETGLSEEDRALLIRARTAIEAGNRPEP